MVSNKTLKTLLVSAVALTIAGGVASTANAAGDKEKCFGVVKAGANDCGAVDKSHSCASQSKVDGGLNEFIALPTGVCEKLVGGHTTPGEHDHDKKPHGEE